MPAGGGCLEGGGVRDLRERDGSKDGLGAARETDPETDRLGQERGGDGDDS